MPHVPKRCSPLGMGRVLCVFSRILGLRSISDEARKVLEDSDIPANYIYLEEADYQRTRPSLLARMSNSYQSIDAARQRLRAEDIDPNDYDIILCVSHHVAAAIGPLKHSARLIVVYDSTPRMAHRGNLRSDTSARNLIASRAATALDLIFFRPLFKRADALLAMSESAKDSTIHDYGADANAVSIIYTPVDVCVPRSQFHAPRRLLFVGNDFYRKGGDLLLQIFHLHLSHYCELWIVSSDSRVKAYEGMDGIKVLGHLARDELLKLYRRVDAFVLPTRRDEGGSAICEAVGAGLPVIVRDAGGQRDWVKSGYNGQLLPYESSAGEWAAAIQGAVEELETFQRYSCGSISVASALLSREHFTRTLLASLASDIQRTPRPSGA